MGQVHWEWSPLKNSGLRWSGNKCIIDVKPRETVCEPGGADQQLLFLHNSQGLNWFADNWIHMVRIYKILQHFIQHLTPFFTFQTKRKFKESNSQEEERWEGRSHILFLVSPKTSPNCFFFWIDKLAKYVSVILRTGGRRTRWRESKEGGGTESRQWSRWKSVHFVMGDGKLNLYG